MRRSWKTITFIGFSIKLEEHFAISNLILKGNENEEYPILTPSKIKRQRRREITVGLLGLQPSRINKDTAEEYQMESVYIQEDEEQE